MPFTFNAVETPAPLPMIISAVPGAVMPLPSASKTPPAPTVTTPLPASSEALETIVVPVGVIRLPPAANVSLRPRMIWVPASTVPPLTIDRMPAVPNRPT